MTEWLAGYLSGLAVCWLAVLAAELAVEVAVSGWWSGEADSSL